MVSASRGALEPEVTAKKGRKRAVTITASPENENNASDDNAINTSPPALSNRRAATIAVQKARTEEEEATKAAEPQFELKLPKALKNWDHNKCDCCYKIKAACESTEPCPNCIVGAAECTKKEGRKIFSMKRADEFTKQKLRFDEVSGNRGHDEVKMKLTSV